MQPPRAPQPQPQPLHQQNARIIDNYAVQLNAQCARNKIMCLQQCERQQQQQQQQPQQQQQQQRAACVNKCNMTADICTFSPP